MRKWTMCVFILLLALPTGAAQPQTEDQKTLYALGVHVAQQLSSFNLSAQEFEFVKEGIADAAAGKILAASPEDYAQNLNDLSQARMLITAQKQKDLSRAYLEKAAQERGAEKTASGLIYQQIKAGNGTHPKASDTVRVHYTGTFIDGKEFDSSVTRGQPAEFDLGQVIACWTEGVSKMKVGGKSRLVCPSDLAYGDTGRPPYIPGGATLVFEVELLDVKASGTPVPASKPKAKK